METLVGGHVVARALKQQGVTCVFTLCGGHVAPIYDGCLQEGIDIVDTRHEQAAAHAADAWARLSRQAGVAIVTAGPGVTDAVTGVANALKARSPLVVLGGAAELRVLGRGALQEMSQVELMRPITKWAMTATDPRRLAEYVAMAFRHALAAPMGPVFLELPFDVLVGQVSDPVFPAVPAPRPRAPGDPAAVAAAAAHLAHARRPVLFAGSQVWWDDGIAALRALVERAHVPALTNGMARGALGPGHALGFSAARKAALERADLVVLAGVPLDFRVDYGRGIAPGAVIVQIERDESDFARNRRVDVAIAGDAASVLGQLTAALPSGIDHGAWAQELRAEETRRREQQAEWERDDRQPINHLRFGRAVADAVDADTIIIGDGGDIVAMTAKVLEPARAGQWLDPGPLGCLGIGAPFALAAKKLYPRAKVLVVSGDGSFGLNGFDFETCVRLGLPVTVVVGNDAAWGQIRGPQTMIFGAARAPATRLAPTRYDRVVEAFGGRGLTITDPRELTPALRAALASDVVTCINVPIDPEFMVRTGASKLSV
ncbi:MAG TPA: thiamine pyrophosphate-binding protein [Polyangia bacterium]|jgi:acetolactate synthase-1/2/3 large subunit